MWLPDVLLGLSTASDGRVSLAGVRAGLAVAAMEPLLAPLLDAIAAVERTPVTLDRELPDDRRMHAIRRVRPETLRWVALHSEVAVALRGSALESSVGADPWVPTRVPEATVDHPANRAVRWYAERVAGVLDPLAVALRKASSGLMDATTAWFLALARPRESAPVGASFELYELWCPLAVRRSIDEALGAGEWECGAFGDDPLLAHDLGGMSLRRAHAGGALLLRYDHTSSAQAGRSRHALTGEGSTFAFTIPAV